jgi:stage V sporulation protein B
MKLLFLKAYDGYKILKYLSLSIPFIIVTQTTTSVLQGTNHYIRPVINLFIGCAVKVMLTMFLVPIPQINIFGAVIASVSAYIIVTILNIISLKAKIKTKLYVYDSIIKPLLASLIMGVVVSITYIFAMERINNNSISCLLSIFMGIIIYIIAILILKVFRMDEIKNRIVRK